MMLHDVSFLVPVACTSRQRSARVLLGSAPSYGRGRTSADESRRLDSGRESARGMGAGGCADRSTGGAELSACEAEEWRLFASTTRRWASHRGSDMPMWSGFRTSCLHGEPLLAAAFAAREIPR